MVVTQPDRLPTCVRVFSPVFMVLEGRECTRPTHSVPVALEFAAVLCFRQLTTPFFMHPFMYHDTCNPCIPKCLHSTHTCMLYIVFYSVRFKLKTLKDGIVLRIDVCQVSWPTRVLWMCVRTPPCVIACINVCAHVKDPVVHTCQSSVDYGNTKTSSVHQRLGSATLSEFAFPEESNSYFLWQKSQKDNTVVKKGIKLEIKEGEEETEPVPQSLLLSCALCFKLLTTPLFLARSSCTMTLAIHACIPKFLHSTHT